MSRVQSITVDRNQFQELIEKNETNVLVFKFGAEWCGPCKRAKPLIHSYTNAMPSNVYVFDVDVDDSFDLYAWMKSKRQVNGIPVMLAYYPSNKTFAPSHSVTGADPNAIKMFFDEIHKAALNL